MKNNKYQITKSRDGQFYFELIANNSKTILTSETYTTKQNCINGIESCKKHSLEDRFFIREISSDNKFYFNLRASNGQPIGTSEMYETNQGRENGIESVKENGPISPIVDESKNENISTDDEIVDIELCAKCGQTPPKGKKYKILIDRKHFVVEKECMTGKEILSLTGETPPERFQLRQKFKDGRVITIKNDQIVCFTEPGIEKFKTLACDQTEGESPRRGFTLLEEDQEYLDSLELKWETIRDGNNSWVLIHNYPIPKGYNVSEATIAIMMTPGYPTAQLDMVYFNPSLIRLDQQPIGALASLKIENIIYQRWSRHRTPLNPWRPGIDNLSTHVPLVDVWLLQEFEKRPYHGISA